MYFSALTMNSLTSFNVAPVSGGNRRRCHDRRLLPPETGATLTEMQLFIHNVLKYITQKMWRDLQNIHSVLFEILSWDGTLTPYDTELRAWFTDHVLSQSQVGLMAEWKFLTVVVNKKPCYVAFDLSQFRIDRDFVSTLAHLKGYVEASPFVPILALRLPTADHVEWLGAFWGGWVTRGIYNSPDNAFLRHMRRHIDLAWPSARDNDNHQQQWEGLFHNIVNSHSVSPTKHQGLWHMWCGEKLGTAMNTVITTQCQPSSGVQRWHKQRRYSVYVEGFAKHYFRNWNQWKTERGADVGPKRSAWQRMKDWWEGPNIAQMDVANFEPLTGPRPPKRRRLDL